MDDTTLRTLAERLQYLRNLAQRREEIRRSIAAQEKLTDELDAALQAAVTLSELEDLYRPYKPKRRTRATIARERGLAPLAEQLLGQARDLPDPLTLAAGFADPARGVETPEDALAGASDIVAETVSDDAAVRKALRSLMRVSPFCTRRPRRERRRRPPSISSIMTSASRCPGCRATRSSP